MDCSLPGSSVHGISQAKILEGVAIPISRESLRPRDKTCISCIAGRFLTTERPGKPEEQVVQRQSGIREAEGDGERMAWTNVGAREMVTRGWILAHSEGADTMICQCIGLWGVRDFGLFQRFGPTQLETCSFGCGWILFEMYVRHPRGGVKDGADIQRWSPEERSEQ